MEELKLNKKFNTEKEMDEYIKKISEEYIVFMINLAPATIEGPENYEIESIYHFGKR